MCIRDSLVAGQLPALARLGPLGHLDLNLLGLGQILDGDAEAAAGHLLDGAVAAVAVVAGQVASRVFTPLTGVCLLYTSRCV